MTRSLLFVIAVWLHQPLLAFMPGQDSKVLVDGSKAEGVEFRREAWKRGSDCLSGRGEGNRLESHVYLGTGAFTVRAELTLLQLERSQVTLHLGENALVLASDSDGSPWALTGDAFERGTIKGIAESASLLRGNKRFEIELRRVMGEFVVLVDGVQVLSARMKRDTLGRFGIDPMKAHVRLHSLVISGNLLKPLDMVGERLRSVQPEIDQAIDDGVQALLRHQLRDGSWDEHSDWYPGGATALGAYTLLKSGLPASHPGAVRALTYLESRLPGEVYSLGCEMMALQATQDPKHAGRLNELADLLVSWQHSGTFGYPGDPPQNRNPRTAWVDLSNTQYAALGFRAARLAKIELPKKAWLSLIEGTLAYQTQSDVVQAKQRKGRTGSGRMQVAGFSYKPKQQRATGSMTCAGVSILSIGLEALGDRCPAHVRERARRAIEQGTNWLQHHFSVTNNPGNRRAWHLYYLYGLERVGSLLSLEHLGPHAWYLEGAKHLIQSQKPNGEWGSTSETCFAILFLKRATAARPVVTGREKGGKKESSRLSKAETEEDQVHLRASGESPLTLWMSGMAKSVRLKYGDDLRVLRVTYLVNEKPVAERRGDPDRAWKGEQLAIRHAFDRAGTYRVQAVATVQVGSGEGAGKEIELKGPVSRSRSMRFSSPGWRLQPVPLATI